MRPPLCMSTTMSERGKSSVERKCASCSSARPVAEPGNERFMFAPDGQSRVYPRDASIETHGITVTRPWTCSGRNSRARFSAATWPSGSSPWTPPRTSAVGPSPLATVTIGTYWFDHPLSLDERGTCSLPTCFPGASRSMVQRIGESVMTAGHPSSRIVDNFAIVDNPGEAASHPSTAVETP